MLKIQYRNAKDGGIEVLRCFSQEQQVTIPAQIEGKAVTKIGDCLLYTSDAADEL